MSGTGVVSAVYGANEPDSNKPAREVIVDLPGGAWTSFMVPVGNDPPIGAAISWGPHHAWWPGHKVDKLTWACDPNAPLSPP